MVLVDLFGGITVKDDFWEACNSTGMHCRLPMPSLNRVPSVSEPNLATQLGPSNLNCQPPVRRPTRSWRFRRLGSAWRFVPVFPGSGRQNKLCPPVLRAGNATSAPPISFAEIIGALQRPGRNRVGGAGAHFRMH